MIVREAKKSDFEFCVALGIEFAEVSKCSHGLSISRRKIEEFTNTVIENPNWISLVLEDEGEIKGIFTAAIIQTFFSEDIIAQELVWYVKEFSKEGLKLLFEFEKQCEERKVQKIVLGYKHSFVDMKKIYTRMGYRLLESQYIKGL
jgi:hypothetical protein